MEQNRLRGVIDAQGLEFGATESGQAWCIKALHPSDPLTATAGLPDGSASSSVMMNYQTAVTFSDPVAAETWDFSLWLTPHPISFAYISVLNEPGIDPIYVTNPQVTGATVYEKTRQFLRLCERFRLCYMSVTLVHNASATTNQGSVVACQHLSVPRDVTTSLGTSLTHAIAACMPVSCYQYEDFPSYNECQAMPSAYLGAMRDGVYMPLKLTDTAQQWHSMRDCRYWTSADTYSYDVLGYKVLPVFTTPDSAVPPYGVKAIRMSDQSETPSIGGQFTFLPMCDNNGYICGAGISKSSSITAYFRVGIEMQVTPLSSLAPQQVIAPSHDELALRSYFAIARLLKDAYPADYNDRDKLWKVINTAASTALPLVLNTIAPGLGSIVSPIVGASEMYRKKRNQKRKQKKKQLAVTTTYKTRPKPSGPPLPPRGKKNSRGGKAR